MARCVESGGRFVEKNQVRLVKKRLGETKAAQHAPAERSQGTVGITGQPGTFEQGVTVLATLGSNSTAGLARGAPVETMESVKQLQHIACTQLGREGRAVRQKTDAFAGTLVLERISEGAGATARLALDPRCDSQERALPRPIRPDESDAGPGWNAKTDALEHGCVRAKEPAGVDEGDIVQGQSCGFPTGSSMVLDFRPRRRHGVIIGSGRETSTPAAWRGSEVLDILTPTMLLRLFRSWRRPPRDMPRLVLYSRPGCQLCDEMKHTLQGLRVAPRFRLDEVNIENDAQLLARFERSIPVLEIAGRVAFKGRMEASDFRRKYARILAEESKA